MTTQEPMTAESFPPGTLRHQKEDGSWVVARPHDPLYSLAGMFATEYWDVLSKSWKQIDEIPEA